ncbi:TPA: DNA repair protein RadC [Yersinia enterocolitica]|nr:DNA repair protein RadC [Yersinia enterocolitica]
MYEISLTRTFTASEENIIQQALSLIEKQLEREPQTFTSTSMTTKWLCLKMAGLEREVFMVLYLDNQHRLLNYEINALGTINRTQVHPREIVKGALAHNAAAVVFAHNHPSGVTEPSDTDRQITNKLVSALQLVDVRVLDHVVTGEGVAVSFAERGWL